MLGREITGDDKQKFRDPHHCGHCEETLSEMKNHHNCHGFRPRQSSVELPDEANSMTAHHNCFERGSHIRQDHHPRENGNCACSATHKIWGYPSCPRDGVGKMCHLN